MAMAQVYVLDNTVIGYIILEEPDASLSAGFSGAATCIIVDNHLESTKYYELLDGAVSAGSITD